MEKRERNLAKLNAMLCNIDISASSIDKRLMKLNSEHLAQCEAAEAENISGCDVCSTSTGSETVCAASIKTASSSDMLQVPRASKFHACYMQWTVNGAAALGRSTRKTFQLVVEKEDGLRNARSPSPRAASPAMKPFQWDEQQALSAELESTRTPSPGSSDVPDIAPYSPFELPPSLAPPHEFDETESVLVVDRLLQLLANPSKVKRQKKVVFANQQSDIVVPLTVSQYSACSSWQPAPVFAQADQQGLHQRYNESEMQWVNDERVWENQPCGSSKFCSAASIRPLSILQPGQPSPVERLARIVRSR
eukprot:TRINITY_DN17329_c0_g1_i1.p1 TRINITY_DN17329_c0_g1~~TRINITY_DN17329_c0_g1_i1.p1  ORF type:complete len:307 (+),score=44.81 TRINITY_DN17329_c0_g1_i1:80-1000(+)